MKCVRADLCLLLRVLQFKDALAVISKLVREVRKFDDKLLLVEIQLIESRVHHALLNIPKAKVNKDPSPGCMAETLLPSSRVL